MIQSDLLTSIRSLAKNAVAKEQELRDRLTQLSASLVELCKGVNIHASTSNLVFFEIEPIDEYERGYLSFDCTEGIRICHRDSYADMAAADAPDPYGESYKIKQIEDTPIDWLRRAVDKGKVKELLENLVQQLQRHGADFEGAAQEVEKLYATPSAAIESDLVEIAQQVGYATVIDDWHEAVSDITADPSSAIARACSLIESTSKHVLADLGEPLPADLSVYPLFKATAKALGLDPEGQAEPELRGLCGGMATVAQNIGALRTKFSIAHGHGPQHEPLTASHARLAVNAAGNITTFLMEQWMARKSKESS